MASFGSTNAPWTHSFPSAKLVVTALPVCLEGASAREGWRGAREAMRTLAKWVGTAAVRSYEDRNSDEEENALEPEKIAER
jgi:hypothetical protein